MGRKHRNPAAAGRAVARGVKPEGRKRDAKSFLSSAAAFVRREDDAIWQFHDVCGGVLDVTVIVPGTMLAVATRAMAGDQRAAAVLLAVGGLLRQCEAAEARRAPLCVSCDFEFRKGVHPAAFVLAVPFAAETDVALISGICATCAGHGDCEALAALALRCWRAVWPDAQFVEWGHS
jgi:hypothetical protein